MYIHFLIWLNLFIYLFVSKGIKCSFSIAIYITIIIRIHSANFCHHVFFVNAWLYYIFVFQNKVKTLCISLRVMNVIFHFFYKYQFMKVIYDDDIDVIRRETKKNRLTRSENLDHLFGDNDTTCR